MRRRVGFWLRLGSSDPFVCVVPAGLLRTFLVSTDGRQMTVRYGRRGDIVGCRDPVRGSVAEHRATRTDCCQPAIDDVLYLSRTVAAEFN